MRFFGTSAAVLRSYDWLLCAIVFVLVSIGFAAIYSVDLSRSGSGQLSYVPQQAIACFMGVAALFVGGRFRLSVFRSSVRAVYVAAAALLIAVLFWGETIRGTRGWFVFESLGSFQPAEFAKLALVLFLAALISRVGRRFDSVQFLLGSALPVFFFVGLILLQPDAGSGAVLVALWIGMLIGTVKQKRYLFSPIAALALVSLFGWFFLFEPYQQERFLTFLQPGRDPLGAGYNVQQSMIAVGAGKMFGRGLGFGSQSQLRFLPEAQTDFIFSVIAEDLGFVGVGIVLLLYFFLLCRLLVIARRSVDDFGAYAVLGVAWLFFIQIVLNIGAATGLLPITGVTLPFLSYGGSSLLINFFLLGIVQSVFRSTA